MSTKTLLITSVLFGFLLSAAAGQCFADAAEELKQALSYDQTGNYEQAETAYQQVVTEYPDSDEAFAAQKQLTALYALRANEAEAQAAMAKLLADFSEREYLPHAVHEIVEKCGKSRDDQRVWQVCRDMLQAAASGNNAIWSKMGLAILDICLGDQLAAQSKIDSLIAEYSEDERSSEALGQLGYAYRKQKRYAKAAELYQCVVENWSDKPRAIFSYRGLVYCKVALDDEAGAWTVVQNMLGRFAADEHVAEVAQALGRQYDRRGQRDKARELYEYVLTNKPRSAHAMWAQRGIVLMDIETGNYSGAEAGIDTMLAKYQDHIDLPQAMQWLGNDYYKAKQYDKAARCYKDVVDNSPQSQYALGAQKGLILSNVKLKDGPAADAAVDDLFAKIARGEDVAPAALELGDQCRRSLSAYGAARRLYQGLLSNYGESEEAMWAQRGMIFVDIKLGNYTAAESGIETLKADYPDHEDLPQAMQWLGNDYYKAGQYDKAINWYRHVVDNSIASEYAMGAQKGLVRSRVKLNDDPNTIAAIDDLFAKFAGRGDVARAAAEVADECRRDLGAYDPARRLYEKLLATYPDSTQAMRAQRGIVNIDIKTGNYTAAEAGVQTLLTKYVEHPDLPKAFYWLGNDYLDARQNDLAAECYQYTIDNRPGTTEEMLSWSGIGRVHIRRGEDEDANDVVNKIIADFNGHPDLPEAVFIVGEEYYNMAFQNEGRGLTAESEENFLKATEIWERIITELPPSRITPEAYLLSAVCYRRLGEYEQALEYYQKIVSDWPDYKYAWAAQAQIGRTCEYLRNVGVIPKSEADIIIRDAYEAVLDKYPNCPAAPAARNRLKSNRYQNQGQDALGLLKPPPPPPNKGEEK